MWQRVRDRRQRPLSRLLLDRPGASPQSFHLCPRVLRIERSLRGAPGGSAMRMTRLAVSVAALGATLLAAGAASAQHGPRGHRPNAATTPPRPPSVPVRAETPAPAQPATAAQQGASASDAAYDTRFERGQRIVVFRNPVQVHAPPQRPYPFSVAGRSPLGYQYQDQPVHFVDQVVAVTHGAPY
jgi:hypothetical protein